MSDRTEELAALAQNGDAEAFGELYELYYKDMYRYALYVTGGEDAAADAVSDAALSAFSQIRSLKNAGAFKSWIFKILLAACKRRYTQERKRRLEVCLDDENSGLNEPSNLDDLTISLELKTALETLANDERETVLLAVLGKYKSREIAEALGCPPSTARSKLKRALAKLRKALGDEKNERGDKNE